jgi:hypothetical protein
MNNHAGSCPAVARRGRRENNDEQQHNHDRQECFSGDVFEELGFSIIRRTPVGSNNTKDRRFTSHFGLKPELVSVVWSELVNSGWLQYAGRKPKPEHLLWCLLFLNTYGVEEINAARVEASERSFHEWAWFYAEGIAKLDTKFVR